jgi:ATP-dependent protease HslVU (ClpYQ) peptidase subunit
MATAMTCIVGLEHDGGVIIGGDAAAIEDLRLTIRTDPKVFTVDDYLIGFCDSFRMGQLLQYRLSVPKQKAHTTNFAHMATTFTDAVRKTFHQGGFARTDDGGEVGGVFLVAYRATLYCVDEDHHIGHAALGYEAIGVGAEYALGSMYTTRHQTDARARVQTALEAAALHSAGVCPPFTILNQPTTPEEIW